MQNNFKIAAAPIGISHSELADEKEIKKIQEHFCDVTNLFVCCLDHKGQWITDMSGDTNDIRRLKELIPMSCWMALYERVAGDSLEEQVIEDTAYPGLKTAAVSVRSEGKPIIHWLICAVLCDAQEGIQDQENVLQDITRKTDEQKFYSALDLLRRMSALVLESRVHLGNVEAENRRYKMSQEEMASSLKRAEAITEIVQLLESEESIEVIMGNIIATAGRYLHISSVRVSRLCKDGTSVEVLARWDQTGNGTAPSEKKMGECPALFRTDKTLVISSDTKVNPEEDRFLEEHHIKALIMIPIFINGAAGMSVLFTACEKQKIWQIEDIRFANNASKILQSIVIRRIQKNSLASSYASLEAILDNVGSAIYVKDLASKQILFANKTLRENFKEEYANGTLEELFEKGKPLGRKGGTFEINYMLRNKWYDLHYTYIHWVDGRQVALCSVYDITDKKIYQKKIERQANTDFLTGLYNRMCCERDLTGHIADARIHHKQGALMYMDLDDFKHINDGLGHQYGDVLLKSVSYDLQHVEGIESTCYRVGGDEFVIVVPTESFPRFKMILEQVREIFSKPWFLKDADYYCTMSMGVVYFPKDGISVQDLIKKADIAMYEAKKSGKNRVAYYSDKISSASNKRLDIEKNMRAATIGGYEEFEVYYQPIIDIQKEGTPCTGAEALLRWNSPKLGYIQPADFIPLAEYLGLINPIGNHVLQEACYTCKRWNDSGYPDYKINVNLSVIQLLQADIVDLVAKTLQETGLQPKNLTLEVTESLAINDMEKMKKILKEIKTLGVRIALDDFGTGYSSLNHIKEIPFDVIKVDQTFVTDLAEDAYSQSFIKMIAELADSIGVSICVEGIESREQYKVLEGMKVRLIQGFYVDRPMPRKDFENKYVKAIEM